MLDFRGKGICIHPAAPELPTNKCTFVFSEKNKNTDGKLKINEMLSFLVASYCTVF